MIEALEMSLKTLENTEGIEDECDEPGAMNIVCAWCGTHIKIRNGASETTSHGICEPCFDNFEV